MQWFIFFQSQWVALQTCSICFTLELPVSSLCVKTLFHQTHAFFFLMHADDGTHHETQSSPRNSTWKDYYVHWAEILDEYN